MARGSDDKRTTSAVDDEDDEKLRTLWCGGLSEKVTDTILYELFLNAGPLDKITIPAAGSCILCIMFVLDILNLTLTFILVFG